MKAKSIFFAKKEILPKTKVFFFKIQTAKFDTCQKKNSFFFLELEGAELGLAVDEADVELTGLADDGLAGLGADGVGDDTGVLLVLHEEHVEVLGGVDHEVLEAIGVDELGGAVGTVTLVGHGLLSLVAAADGRVDTAGLAPRGADLLEELALVAGELLGALLDDGTADGRLGHCDFCCF